MPREIGIQRGVIERVVEENKEEVYNGGEWGRDFNARIGLEERNGED